MKDIAFTLDEKAKGLASDYLRTEGELLSVLMEMRKRKVFAELNYTGIFDYCERALNLSRAQAYYFKSVAEKSEEVPEIKAAVVQGELTLSQARRIIPVVTKDNHALWIGKAKVLPQLELEREVTSINPNARIREKIRPVAKELSELKVPLDRQTEQNLGALKEILSQKLGKPATLAQVIAWAAEVTREKFDPIRKAQRAVSSGKVSSATTVQPMEGRRRIAAVVKYPVILRDGMQCTFVGRDGRRCEQKRWLDTHHITPVANGGHNTIDNLRLLCRAHHDLVHSGKRQTG